MSDRIPRPPVKIRGGVPDGIQLNGLGDVAKHFLRAEPDPKFAIVQLGRRQLIHDDDEGSDIAVLEIHAIEVPGEAGQLELERMILSHRDIRTAAGTLPFDQPYESNDVDRALDLAHRIQVWADLDSKDARAEWEGFFGPYGDDVPTGPKGGSLEHLLQFCEHFGIPTRDEPAGVPDEVTAELPDDVPDGDGLDGIPTGRAWLNEPEPADPAFSDNR
jgi:hypothetical protein